ncbi:MAG: OsmC family protein [Vicinamibacteraceae bacterium]
MSDERKPPINVELTWESDLRFRARADDNQLIVDGDSGAGMSPMQLVACGLAGCMAIDVVHILTRGRQTLAGFGARVAGERAPGTPASYTRITLHFVVNGRVPHEAVERAIQLSRDKYCSVWHSLRRDIDLATTFEIVEA